MSMATPNTAGAAAIENGDAKDDKEKTVDFYTASYNLTNVLMLISSLVLIAVVQAISSVTEVDCLAADGRSQAQSEPGTPFFSTSMRLLATGQYAYFLAISSLILSMTMGVQAQLLALLGSKSKFHKVLTFFVGLIVWALNVGTLLSLNIMIQSLFDIKFPAYSANAFASATTWTISPFLYESYLNKSIISSESQGHAAYLNYVFTIIFSVTGSILMVLPLACVFREKEHKELV